VCDPSLFIIDSYTCTLLTAVLQGRECQRQVIPHIDALAVLLQVNAHYAAGVV
jgi:hypothetical protein